jgi:hypothetical protein
VFDPDAEGVDTLDFLENLAFTNFLPAIALVLGDEYGDGVSRNTLRLGQPNTGGQGAFYLSEGIPAVPGQRLTQFNRSPQLSPMPHEENADFVEAAIPLNWIGGLKPGDVIRIGALVALQNVDTNSAAQTREIDIGGIGYSLAHAAGAVYLEGLEVRLASRDDFDGDLVTDAEEDLMGTDWRDPDTDGDGMPDGWEVQHSLHPVLNDADADTDGDGLTNRDEFRAGTNPTSAESRLLLRAEKFTGGFHLVWESVPGRRYLLQMRKSFNEPFGELPGFPRIANTPRISYPISMENGPELSSYYRLLVVE